MQTNISISIIVPSYNRADFLKKNIPNLLLLDYDNYEIIVVDDGSTDDTAQVFNEISDPRLFYYPKQNEERAAARNYGAEQATGDYITFLDSDDELYQDSLKSTAFALKEKGFPAFLHMAYETGTPEKTDKIIDHLKDNDPLILVTGNPLSCIGIFIKRKIFYTQKFNTDRAMSGTEDWECWLRLAANYGLRTGDHIIGKLIDHDSRSVKNFTEKELADRMNLSIMYAFRDPEVQKVYGPYKKTMEAHCDTYIALHLALYGLKKKAIHYLMNGIKKDFTVLFTKRSLVICKFLVSKK